MGSDITEVQELRSQQEFNERMTMLGEMSAFIVHEINNPLSTISLSSEIIEMISKDPQITEKSIKITQMTEVISKIIRSLKSFARNSTEFSEINLVDIIDQAKVIVGPKIKQAGVKISVDIPDGVTLVGTDIDFLQVLVNLLSNSVDAIKDNNGDNWINIVWKDNYLHVIDSGKGIAPANVTKLFQKFHTTKGSKGNGIGLYLSKTILNKNGFDLNYKPTDEGNTSFIWSKVS